MINSDELTSLDKTNEYDDLDQDHQNQDPLTNFQCNCSEKIQKNSYLDLKKRKQSWKMTADLKKIYI